VPYSNGKVTWSTCYCYGWKNVQYAFDGDLFSNQGMNVNLDDALFNEQASQISVPTIATVLDALVQDPDVNAMCPCTNNDAGTEVKIFAK